MEAKSVEIENNVKYVSKDNPRDPQIDVFR